MICDYNDKELLQRVAQIGVRSLNQDELVALRWSKICDAENEATKIITKAIDREYGERVDCVREKDAEIEKLNKEIDELLAD